MWLMAMLLPLYCLSQQPASTINSVLHGRVTDARKGIPLEGATVVIRNTTHSRIIARNLRGEALEKKIAELLN
jgi:hypothetical protein